MKKYLGYLWASPITTIALAYVLTFQAFGWYKLIGRRDDALVWQVDSAPNWLLNAWKSWGGHTLGNVVVVNMDIEKYPVLMKHELAHVRQCMRLGIFQPLIYALSYIAVKLGCPEADPYFDSPFEIEARRYAGEPIDVVGALKKKQETSQK